MRTLCTSLVNFLATASAERIHDYLVDELDATDGELLMHWLAEYRPAVHNAVLCRFFDVACYRVGESCFANQAPASEQALWFVSVLADSELAADTDIRKLPLAPNEELAQAAAVHHLGLAARFRAGTHAMVELYV